MADFNPNPGPQIIVKHQALIDGTYYEISGGNTLVEGVSYAIKNGKVLVDGTEYDIRFILPPGVVDVSTTLNEGIKSLVYANGCWAVLTEHTIWYTTSLDGEWTELVLGEDVYSTESVAFVNGYWIVGYSELAGSVSSPKSHPCIAYSTSLTGEWTYQRIWTSDSGEHGNIYSVAYANGYWVVGATYGYNACIAYSTSLTGEWTRVNLWSGQAYYYSKPYSIIYANGYWVVGGSGGSTIAYIAYATSPDGEWTKKRLWYSSSGSQTRDGYIKRVIYADGYFVACGVEKTYYSSSYETEFEAKIAYTADPAGTWTIKNILRVDNNGSSGQLNDIIYADNQWITVGQYNSGTPLIAYSESLNGTWEIVTSSILTDGFTRNEELTNIVQADGYYVIGGFGKTSAGSDYINRIAYASNFDDLM